MKEQKKRNKMLNTNSTIINLLNLFLFQNTVNIVESIQTTKSGTLIPTHTNTHNVNMLLSKDKLNIARRI